jgi:hypothetical protein
MSTTERVRRLDPEGLAQLRAMSDRLDTLRKINLPQACPALYADEVEEARTLATRMAWRWGWARS